MASDITTSGSFATTNMKPDPGEQGDALWAQKIADNTGYLGGRPALACCLGGVGDSYSQSSTIGTSYATAYFQKLPEYNYLMGTYSGTTNANGQITGYINGVNFFTFGGAGSVWKAGTKYSISSLTNYSWYEVGVKAGHGASGDVAAIRGVSLWFAP